MVQSPKDRAPAPKQENDDPRLRLILRQIGETCDREELVRAGRRDLQELLHRLGVVGQREIAGSERGHGQGAASEFQEFPTV